MTTIQTHSLVSFASEDQRYVGLRAAEPLGYFGLAHGSFETSDFTGLFAGQQLKEAGYATDVDGVLFVGAVIDPLKVRRRRVGLHAVNMVDERKIAWVGDECESDESVDVDRLSLPISIKNDLRIPNSVDAAPDHVTKASSYSGQRMFIGANAVNAPHSPEITDFVKSNEVLDTSPLFVNHHLMGPCARSAHSIVVYSAAQGG